jgi:phosphonate degradation associated HDIG domain protein
MIGSILRLYAERGARAYFGEPVSLLEHSLQTAAAASGAGAPSPLVAAALLHDVGHVLTALAENCAEKGVDDRHERIGGAYLARVFPASVCEPVRLHVAAKRYLCATDPAYFGRLSEASVLSLRLQGGPMSADEASAFAAQPFGSDAVRLRGWDEAAKIAGARTPDLEHFRALLESLALR